MTPRTRIALVAIAAVGLVIAFIAASGSEDQEPTSDTVPRTSTVGTTVATTPAGTTTTGTTTTEAIAPKPATPVVRVVDAQPQGGVRRLEFTKGDPIRFKVRSDTADEIHVHGYDVQKSVVAGGTVAFSIPATIEGRFVVELEHHGTQIAELEVQP